MMDRQNWNETNWPVRWGLVFLFLLFSYGSKSQSTLLLGPQRGIIQSHLHINPAYTPDEKLTVSLLPLLPPFWAPSFGYSLSSSAFALSDVIKPGTNGQTLIDTRAWLENVRPMNTFSASIEVDLFTAGLRLNEQHFISLNISNRAFMNWDYSGEMLELLLEGNGATGVLGKEISPYIHIQGLHYSDIGFGYSTVSMDGRLKAGMRLRYLIGQEHVQTEKSEINLFTDAGDFTIRGDADILIQTAGLQNGIFQGDRKLLSSAYLFGTGNRGGGIDAGLTYRVNDKLELAFAVRDLGFIRWKNDVHTYSSKEPGAAVEFQGVDLIDYRDEPITVEEAFNQLTDSLLSRFELVEENKAYTTGLSAKSNFSLTYSINENQSACVFIHNSHYDRRIHPDISLSYSISHKDWLRTSIAWSYIDRTATNIGFFLAVQPGAFQWYVCSDNLLGILFYDRYEGIPVPAYARHASLRAGFNLTLGKRKSTR